ncbi:hypothetical protein ANN_02389 [Periplaneta americana]|uniref:Tc1-like transposase DDE domain-containing protein n=1 Tax=Periplaneta americana TaxID=6978 RepID=A0ABQ8TW97_PERAM|nr:hypothetical protein ANN_02389 [Periplaneta americana]
MRRHHSTLHKEYHTITVCSVLTLDESTDRNDKAHLAIFIRGDNDHFTVSECLLDVITKYNWRRSFAGTERHHRTEEVEFAMACVNSNRRGSSFIDIHWNASPFLLQHDTQLDNGSWPHVSAATMQWYADNNVHRLDWPAQSPDLNPIEHLWAELDWRLRSWEMRPTSIVQLSAMLQEEWRRIPVDILHKLVESISDRVAAVIATRGGTTSLLSKNLKVRIYKTVILPVVLYGCETWTLTLREEHRLRVFENKALRKIFGAKRDEVTEEWRKLHNAELHALYSSPDIIRNIKSRRLRWAGHVALMGESRNAYRVLVGRPEEKDLCGRRDVDGRIILKWI